MVGQCTNIMGWVPVARIYCVDRLWAHLYYWNFHCDAVSALTCADDSTAVITLVLWFAWGVSLVRAHNPF